MRDFFEILEALKYSIKLEEHKKAALRRHLIHFMEKEGAVRETPPSRLLLQEEQKRAFGIYASFRVANLMPAIAVLIVTLLGGGTSFAAESAIPGDILYPIKVSVNEPLREYVSFSPEAKAAWGVRRVERRLEEVAELAFRNGDESGAKRRLVKTFAAQSNQAELQIKKLEEKNIFGASELANRFEASLKAHEKILAAAAETEEHADPVHLEVKKELVRAELNRLQTEARLIAATKRRLRIRPDWNSTVAPVEKHSETVAPEGGEKLGPLPTMQPGFSPKQKKAEPVKDQTEATENVKIYVIAEQALDRAGTSLRNVEARLILGESRLPNDIHARIRVELETAKKGFFEARTLFFAADFQGALKRAEEIHAILEAAQKALDAG